MAKDTFAEDRRAGLGGTDYPKLLIPNYQYGGPYDVFLEKIEGSNFAGNNATRRGKYFQPGVAQWFSDETGHRLHQLSPETDPGQRMAPVGKEWTLVHPVFDFIRATPDYLTEDPNLGFEAKTANERQLDMVDQFGDPLWGPDRSDIVPLPYLIQCQACMGLSGRRRWDLGAYFVGSRDEFRLYHLEFDPDFFAQLVEVSVSFWRDYIIPRIPPPIDLVPSDRVINRLLDHAVGGGREMQADSVLTDLALRWAAKAAERLNAEEDEKELKSEFTKAMAAAGAAKVKGNVNGRNWSVSAVESSSGFTTNRDAVIAIFKARLLELGVPAEELEGILADNQVPTQTAGYVRGYFTSLNKDRKAIRNAQKGNERISA